MTETPKILAQGQMASSKGTIFTCPDQPPGVVLRFLGLYNTSGATTETVLIYAKKLGGTSRVIARFVLSPNEWARALGEDDALALSGGDVIEAQSTNAATVDYTVAGMEVR